MTFMSWEELCYIPTICGVCVNNRALTIRTVYSNMICQIFYNYGNYWVTMTINMFWQHFFVTINNDGNKIARSLINNSQKLMYKFYRTT